MTSEELFLVQPSFLQWFLLRENALHFDWIAHRDFFEAIEFWFGVDEGYLDSVVGGITSLSFIEESDDLGLREKLMLGDGRQWWNRTRHGALANDEEGAA